MLCFFTTLIQADNSQSKQPVVLAPGYGPLTFEAPEAGTYSQPVMAKQQMERLLTALE